MIVTDEQRDENLDAEEAAPAETPVVDVEDAPQYGVGPFTVRELALVGVWLVAFVISFFSIYTDRRFTLLPEGAEASVWTSGLEWVLTIGVPTVAVFLIVLRRFSPDGIRRVGSLAIDQFASVAFSVSAMVWLIWLWSNIGTAINSEGWSGSTAGWSGSSSSSCSPASCSRSSRRSSPCSSRTSRAGRRSRRTAMRAPCAASRRVRRAHRVPWPMMAGMPQPSPRSPGRTRIRPTRATAIEDPTLVDQPVAGSDSWAPSHARDTFEPVAPAADAQARQQAFWALAPEERNVVDESGIPIFRVGPTAWALVIEDRGETFVVRNEDGRIGYLHDVEGVTRG